MGRCIGVDGVAVKLTDHQPQKPNIIAWLSKTNLGIRNSFLFIILSWGKLG